MIDWLNNFFGIKNEVSVPTLISLIVFIIGGTISYLFTKIKEYNNRKISRKTFTLLLNEVIIDLRNKEKNIAKFHPQISVLNENNFTYTQVSINYLETIFELDFKDVYYAFRKKIYYAIFYRNLKHKAFHKIWAVLRKQKFFEEKIQSSVDHLSSTLNSKIKIYYSNLEEYRKYSDELKHKNTGIVHNNKLSSYFIEFDNIWLKWENLGEIRTFYYYSYNNLVQPLLELNRKYSDLEITLKSATLLLDCYSAYFEIENIINTYEIQFKIYENMYKNDQRILKKCLLIIE